MPAKSRASPTRSIPVIAVTASAMPEDRKKILAAGFDGMQTIPIHVVEVPGQCGKGAQDPGERA